MDKILKVHTVNDYARYIGAPVLHPLVSVIHYDELEHCRHSLNNYDVYAMFLSDEPLPELVYGLMRYTMHRHTLMCVAPGQVGGKRDTGEEIHVTGWALLFDPQLLHGTDLGRRMPTYHFFTYNTSEALPLGDEERQTLVDLFEQMRRELATDDEHTRPIVVALLQQVLEQCARFYARNLSLKSERSTDLLLRLENLLERYYGEDRHLSLGQPTVRYCAQELFLSPGYFGDLIRQQTGDSATAYLRSFTMRRAQALLASGSTIAEAAEALGFDYAQHFSRAFKRHFGIPPSEFIKKK